MAFEQAIIMNPSNMDQFAALVAGLVMKEVLKMRTVEEPLTKQGAANYFKITVRALNERIAKGKIPGKYIHRNGGTPYFFASELETLLKKNQ